MSKLRLVGFVLMYWLVVPGPGGLHAQQKDRVTEEIVNIEKVFIEASREKILGNYENAAMLYKEVLKRDNANDAAAYELARVYDALDKDDKALSSIQMAIALDKKNSWYRTFLGDVYDKAGKYKKAAEVYEELANMEPEKSYFYSKWAFYLVKAKEPQKALKVYDKVEKLTGLNEELARKKHTLYLGLGDTKRAAGVYQQLINLFPYETKYYHYLADYYKYAGEKTLAIQVYENILRVDPNDTDAQLAIAGAGKGNADEIGYLGSLQPIFYNADVDIDTKIKELIPFINKVVDTRDKTLGRAILDLTSIIEEMHPNEAKGFSAAGDVLFHMGDKDTALEKYNKAIALNSNVFAVWEQVMYIHADNGNYLALLEVTEKSLDYFPNQAKSYYFNGIAAYNLDKNKDAVNAWRQALMMSRKDPVLQYDLHYRLGLSYHELKQYDKADDAFTKAMEINPDDVRLLNNYAYQLAERGEHLDRARKMAERCNKLKPNNPSFQETYGWVLYKLKDYKEAKTWMEKAIDNGGDNFPDTLEHYGDVLFQLGETDQAIEYWRQAQQKGSTSNILEKKITDKVLYE